jgi:hypothetical protein
LLPLAIVGPVAGVFVDRWNVKRTMIASDLTRAVLAALLVMATDVRQIYVILFALSSVSSFFIPAQSVTLRTIVPPAGLMSANALMQNAIQLMQIISPAIAGVVASVSAKACFWLDSVSFLFSASMIYTLKIDREPSRTPLNFVTIIKEMNAGMKFIFTHNAVSFVIISLTAGMFAIRCFFALIAVYVRDVLHGGSALFGSISSLVGIGIIAGTQFIHHFARTKSKGHLVILRFGRDWHIDRADGCLSEYTCDDGGHARHRFLGRVPDRPHAGSAAGRDAQGNAGTRQQQPDVGDVAVAGARHVRRGPNRGGNRNPESLLFERRPAARDRRVRLSADSKARLSSPYLIHIPGDWMLGGVPWNSRDQATGPVSRALTRCYHDNRCQCFRPDCN